MACLVIGSSSTNAYGCVTSTRVEKVLTAMLTTIQSAGVAPEMNLINLLHRK